MLKRNASWSSLEAPGNSDANLTIWDFGKVAMTGYRKVTPPFPEADYVLYQVTVMETGGQSIIAHYVTWIDLGRALYVLYGVKYIDLVSLANPRAAAISPTTRRGLASLHLDLSRALCFVWCKFIDLVSPCALFRPPVHD